MQTAIVAPMLSGKSTYTRTHTLRDNVIDVDTLYDHQALLSAFGEPQPNWSQQQWALWNDRLISSVANALRKLPSTVIILLHSASTAEQLGLPVRGFVLIPGPVFRARQAASPDRARLAELNREQTLQDATTSRGMFIPVGSSIEQTLLLAFGPYGTTR